jgi:hypothetical protein
LKVNRDLITKETGNGRMRGDEEAVDDKISGHSEADRR